MVGNVNLVEPYTSNQIVSAYGHLYWHPVVSDDIRPIVGAKYPSYDHVKAMYYYYAVQSGFYVRKHTEKKLNGVVSLKYFVCNREGEPNCSSHDSLDTNIRLKKRMDSLSRMSMR